MKTIPEIIDFLKTHDPDRNRVVVLRNKQTGKFVEMDFQEYLQILISRITPSKEETLRKIYNEIILKKQTQG